ncbi:hypothetical protein [Streptomyces sp. NPDC056242]|uniref:hypothetical protein n=1 Tax=Streptomyces sp. NPDC056242 TaxID=3345760 RepID=UPI0035DEF4E3
MGQSTDAILAYGYDLGEGLQNIREAGEYGELPPLSWLDENGDEDLADAVERRLLAEVIGFTETWSSGNEGYFGREREAKARLGVEIQTYCSESCPMYVLAAHVIRVSRGDAEMLHPRSLADQPDLEGWDEKLRVALEALGITPTQERAQWLLCSYWGC